MDTPVRLVVENTILVSAFINIGNKTLDEYINNGKKLIQQRIKKIIFMDSKIINLFESDNLTTLVPISFNDLYLSKYSLINTINTDNLNKDTLEYFILCDGLPTGLGN